VVNFKLTEAALVAPPSLMHLQVTIVVACHSLGDFPSAKLMDTLGREADDEEAIEPEKHGGFLVRFSLSI
jgi:hypothetical protein